jgi:hypothetical protein
MNLKPNYAIKIRYRGSNVWDCGWSGIYPKFDPFLFEGFLLGINDLHRFFGEGF